MKVECEAMILKESKKKNGVIGYLLENPEIKVFVPKKLELMSVIKLSGRVRLSVVNGKIWIIYLD